LGTATTGTLVIEEAAGGGLKEAIGGIGRA